MKDQEEMSFEGQEKDQFGHRKLGGIGDRVAAQLKELSPKFNDGKRVNIVNQRLGYLVRCGEPDAHRLDRADGFRQLGARPGPERRVRAACLPPQRLLRQCGD